MMRLNIVKTLLTISMIGGSVLTTSCSSIFSVGHENFRCQGTDKGGVCASVEKIYEHREELLETGKIQSEKNFGINPDEEYSKDIVQIERKVIERDCAYFGGRCALGEEKEKVVKEIKKPIVSLPLPAKQDKYRKIPVPVREEALIQRVLIYPYQTKAGNLVSKHFIYVVVREGRWLSPDGDAYKPSEEDN